MSLILDALRKAEAERQRGQVPGLHGAAPPSLPEPAADAAPRRVAQGLAGLGVLAAAGAVAWWAWPASPPPATGAGTPTAAPVAAPAAVPAPVPALPVVVSAPPAPPPAAAVPDPVRAAPASPPPAPAAAAAPPAPIVTQVRRLADLPPEQRRELPPLAVSGSVWSDQPGARFVVLDGQVLREGDSLQPGLVLVKLAPRSATLRWRDMLVEVPY